MINKEYIRQWLTNPNSTLQDGLEIYDIFKISNEKDDYFRNNMVASRDSMPFKILYRQIDRIYNKFQADEARMVEILKRKRPEMAKPAEAPPVQTKKINIKRDSDGKQQQEQEPIQMREIKRNKKVVDEPFINLAELPEELQKKYFENKQLIAQMNTLHSEMKQCSDNGKRKQLMARIEPLEVKHRDNWEAINMYTRDGIMKEAEAAPEKKELVEDKAKQYEMYRLAGIKNGNIRRALKEYDSLDEKKQAKRIQSMGKWMKELDELAKGMQDPDGARKVNENIVACKNEIKKKGIKI